MKGVLNKGERHTPSYHPSPAQLSPSLQISGLKHQIDQNVARTVISTGAHMLYMYTPHPPSTQSFSTLHVQLPFGQGSGRGDTTPSLRLPRPFSWCQAHCRLVSPHRSSLDEGHTVIFCQYRDSPYYK